MSDYRLHVLVPSRGRPQNVERLLRAIAETAAAPDDVLLCVRLDDDDPVLDEYAEIDPGSGWLYTAYGPRIRLAASWNELAEGSLRDGATHLALWGDDNIPVTHGWDRIFCETLRDHGPGWVYGRDGVWDHTYDRDIPGHLVLPTATVMSIELYRALGWVSPPGLTHLCIDVAWRDLGLAAGALHYRPDVFIRHLHRIAGARDDQTYRDANDNPEQVRGDSIAVAKWKNGRQFQHDLTVVREAREHWSRGAP